jgi:subtilase family serine protease
VKKSVLASCFGAVVLIAAALWVAPADASANGRHAARVCTTPSKPAVAACSAKVLVSDKTGVVPASTTPAASALTPTQLRSAYGLNGLDAHGTVAIIDAYGYPNLERDLGVYRTQFALPACTKASGCLKVVNQTGGSSLPRFNTGWAGETALDVDAVSAICPGCKILVVQASSASIANLGTAAATAAKQSGVVAISNSYGGGDISDASYGSYYNHPGIAVTASTGDDGYQGGSFPASSAYVVAVGGTSLQMSGTTVVGETAWSGAGSGCSTVNTALSAAAAFGTGCAKRAIADVSAAADPAHGGMAVYYPTSSKASTWAQVGGTSESSPIIAAVFALAGGVGTGVQANSVPYAHPSSLRDVISGSNGTCPTLQWCSARAGWDGPTGLGVPNGIGGF